MITVIDNMFRGDGSIHTGIGIASTLFVLGAALGNDLIAFTVCGVNNVLV
jgi:hypothetical protein